MISFKDFLTESRSAPLYHGTTMSKIMNILEKGLVPKTLQERKKLLKPEINTSNSDWKTIKKTRYPYHMQGVSTSRSFKMASNWGEGIVIELDQRLLAQRYEIKPVQYFQSPEYNISRPARILDFTGFGNEYEEFIITDKPISPKFFTRLYVPAQWLGSSLTRTPFDKIRQERGASFIVTY